LGEASRKKKRSAVQHTGWLAARLPSQSSAKIHLQKYKYSKNLDISHKNFAAFLFKSGVVFAE
jgi:hypothetical protein